MIDKTDKKIDIDFYLGGLMYLMKNDVTVKQVSRYYKPIVDYIRELEEYKAKHEGLLNDRQDS